RRVYAIAFSPDGKLLASGSHDPRKLPRFPEEIRLWDPATGKRLGRITKAGYQIAFSPDSKLLASAGEDGIHLLDPAAGKKISTFERSYRHIITSLAFSPDGKLLVSSTFAPPSAGPLSQKDPLKPDAMIVRVWDVATGKEVQQLKGHEHYVWKVLFTPDGK